MSASAAVSEAGLGTPRGWFPRWFRVAGWCVLAAMAAFLIVVAAANTASGISGPWDQSLYVTSTVTLIAPLWLCGAAILCVQGRGSRRSLRSELWQASLMLVMWVGYIVSSIVFD